MNQIEILISLFIVVFIGFIAGKTKLINNESTKIFMRFVFYISVPVAVFLDLATSNKDQISQYPKFIAVNTVLLLLFTFILFLVLKSLKISNESKGSSLFTSIDGNVIYFGLPILSSVYSQEHFTLGVIYVVVVVTLVETFGFFLIGILKKNKKLNLLHELIQLCKNPVVIGGVLGFVVMMTGVSLEKSIPSLNNALNTVAKSTTGLALFTLGLYISKSVKIKNFKFVLLSSFNKLLLLPLITYIVVFYLIKLDPVAAQTSVLQAAMPSAVFTLAISEMYDLDREQTSSTILISSLIFLVTSILILALPKM